MIYTDRFPSPLGTLILLSDGEALTGLHFPGAASADAEAAKIPEPELPVFAETKGWLNAYFAGKDPGPLPRLRLSGTAFQTEVWTLLQTIPYGKTVSYGELAARIAAARGIKRMSAQAVGGAVGKNPIGILIPCHRVIGADGSLVGFGGGLDRKQYLLALEAAGSAE